MNFFNPKFPQTRDNKPAQRGMFNPGEVVWNAANQGYNMAGPACVCFMLHQAFAPDKELSAEQHHKNRAGVWAGVALAVAQGFGAEARLRQILEAGNPDDAELRSLSDQMLTFVTPERWLECVFAVGKPDMPTPTH